MAYTKQNWECGDLITADKMNHIEDGIEDASSGGSTEPLILTAVIEQVPCSNAPTQTTRRYTYNHSWQEIHDAIAQGRLVMLSSGNGLNELLTMVMSIGYDGAPYVTADGEWYYFADTTSLVYTAECQA